MKLQQLLVVAALVALATPALAVVKVYNADTIGGTPGDQIQYTTTQCPPVQATPGTLTGSHTLTDTGGGTVTMTDRREVQLTQVDLPDLTLAFGPGAFVFIDAEGVGSLSTTPTAPGSTAPGGTVAWGVISGFQRTGVGFCVASPQTICTGGAMLAHGQTIPVPPVASATYDLGTWTFDAQGDFEGSPYVNQTTNGGTANRQFIPRGAYVGASIPALPLVGAAALALGLVVAGTRSVLRKK